MGCSSHPPVGRRAVAQLPVEAEIAGRGVVEPGRGVAQRGLGARHGGERAIGDGDCLGRGAGLGGGLRDDEGDWIAHRAHASGREHRAGRSGGGAAIGVLGRHRAGDRPDAGFGQVGGGVDGQHPGHRRGDARVDHADLGMSVGRAHHAAPRLAGEREVVEDSARGR